MSATDDLAIVPYEENGEGTQEFEVEPRKPDHPHYIEYGYGLSSNAVMGYVFDLLYKRFGLREEKSTVLKEALDKFDYQKISYDNPEHVPYIKDTALAEQLREEFRKGGFDQLMTAIELWARTN